jgi:hypothetical protein
MLDSPRMSVALLRTSSLSKNGLGLLLYRVPNDVRNVVVFFFASKIVLSQCLI